MHHPAATHDTEIELCDMMSMQARAGLATEVHTASQLTSANVANLEAGMRSQMLSMEARLQAMSQQQQHMSSQLHAMDQQVGGSNCFLLSALACVCALNKAWLVQ